MFRGWGEARVDRELVIKATHHKGGNAIKTYWQRSQVVAPDPWAKRPTTQAWQMADPLTAEKWPGRQAVQLVAP